MSCKYCNNEIDTQTFYNNANNPKQADKHVWKLLLITITKISKTLQMQLLQNMCM